ncbi:hypothetical protein BGX28_005283 [Mortierella sp. GBA30]|nr:hypothetical protein BGX28_005283 [Mortierella sp. GBA30]
MSGLSIQEAENYYNRTETGAGDTTTERTPSYSDLPYPVRNGAIQQSCLDRHHADMEEEEEEPPYTAFEATTTHSQDIVVVSAMQPEEHSRLVDQQQQLLNMPASYTTPSGLSATLELESDTVEIYDRSSDGFQYSLKGSVELDWTGEKEVVLKDARIDFMGYADTAVLRYEAGYSALTTETPVHHTHDFIPTPLVLAAATLAANVTSTPSSSLPDSSSPTTVPIADTALNRHHHESLPIDLTLPGHLPDSTNLAIGKIRYELQITLELSLSPGTSIATTEPIILRRPILVHRIVYPSAHLQPRLAMGLDSGGVEIQVKVPRLLHCENTLLAVELYAKPRTRNVKLRRAKVVFEQIETDRYQRTSPLVAVPPTAVVPLVSPNNSSTVVASPTSLQHAILSNTAPQSPPPHFPHQPSSSPAPIPTPPRRAPVAGPPPAPRLLTRNIAEPLEVEFDEPTAELQPQNIHLQLVLSPDLCVDVQSSWLQISHTLRIEIEYTTDEEAYITAPPMSAPPPLPQRTPLTESSEVESELEPEPDVGAKIGTKEYQANAIVSPSPFEPEGLDDNRQPLTAGGEEARGSEIKLQALEQQHRTSTASEDQSTEGIWEQEGDDMETESQSGEDHDVGAVDTDDWRSGYLADEKQLFQDGEGGSGSSTLPNHHHYHYQHFPSLMNGSEVIEDMHLPPRLPVKTNHSNHCNNKNINNATDESTLSEATSSTSSCTFSVATEEIPVRVVRVVATALVDASTIAQAAGETEAGLPTYESVIEATGLPAYAEEKLEDDHEDAEASGTATGVLGGAARRLEGDDAELQRR